MVKKHKALWHFIGENIINNQNNQKNNINQLNNNNQIKEFNPVSRNGNYINKNLYLNHIKRNKSQQLQKINRKINKLDRNKKFI